MGTFLREVLSGMCGWESWRSFSEFQGEPGGFPEVDGISLIV